MSRSADIQSDSKGDPTILATAGVARVTVVVPHYNDLAGLERCLQALEQQSYPREAFEIVVADNASPQGQAAIAKAIGDRARLVIVNEKGAGPARNGGVAVASGEILAFTDSDCQPERDWLREGVRSLTQSDFSGGCMRVLVDDPKKMTSAEAFETVFAFDNEKYVLKKGFTVTANLFCRLDHFGRIGGFKVGVSEDVEWSQRARGLGYSIGYAAGAVVGHPARKSWPDVKRKWARMGAETYGLYLERPGGRLRWFVRSAALPLSAVVHTPRVLSSRQLRRFDQRLAALGMLFRLRAWRFADAMRLLATGRSTHG